MLDRRQNIFNPCPWMSQKATLMEPLITLGRGVVEVHGEFRCMTAVRGNNNADKARRFIKSLMRVTTAFA